VAEPARSRRPWLIPLTIAACVALQLVVVAAPAGHVARVAALLALAAVAVALGLRQTLAGLAASWPLRAAVVGTIALSILLIVVLLLDANVRAAEVLR
jgi:hypothetical protein